IREYALERLEERGERSTLSRTLAEYLVALAEDSPAFHEFRGNSTLSAADLGAELHNMRTALAWALAAPEPELALRLASEAMWFSRGTNTLPENNRWLEEALRIAGSASRETHARALEQAASGARALGDFQRSPN